jgi:hypothetical protein
MKKMISKEIARPVTPQALLIRTDNIRIHLENAELSLGSAHSPKQCVKDLEIAIFGLTDIKTKMEADLLIRKIMYIALSDNHD